MKMPLGRFFFSLVLVIGLISCGRKPATETDVDAGADSQVANNSTSAVSTGATRLSISEKKGESVRMLSVKERAIPLPATAQATAVNGAVSAAEPNAVIAAPTSAASTVVVPNIIVPLRSNAGGVAASLTRLYARSGSKMRVEGTSNLHDWQVESPLIGGFIDVGPNFPLEPGQAVEAGNVDVAAEVFVTGRSLKSVEKDGRPYSDKMDDIMYGKLLVDKFPKITFKLSQLSITQAAGSAESPYVGEAQGSVTAAGVTQTVAMRVNILPLGGGRVKITGSARLKMSDFKIEPPAPKFAFGIIKTGDPVTIRFDWVVAQRASVASK